MSYEEVCRIYFKTHQVTWPCHNEKGEEEEEGRTKKKKILLRQELPWQPSLACGCTGDNLEGWQAKKAAALNSSGYIETWQAVGVRERERAHFLTSCSPPVAPALVRCVPRTRNTKAFSVVAMSDNVKHLCCSPVTGPPQDHKGIWNNSVTGDAALATVCISLDQVGFYAFFCFFVLWGVTFHLVITLSLCNTCPQNTPWKATLTTALCFSFLSM